MWPQNMSTTSGFIFLGKFRIRKEDFSLIFVLSKSRRGNSESPGPFSIPDCIFLPLIKNYETKYLGQTKSSPNFFSCC